MSVATGCPFPSELSCTRTALSQHPGLLGPRQNHSVCSLKLFPASAPDPCKIPEKQCRGFFHSFREQPHFSHNQSSVSQLFSFFEIPNRKC